MNKLSVVLLAQGVLCTFAVAHDLRCYECAPCPPDPFNDAAKDVIPNYCTGLCQKTIRKGIIYRSCVSSPGNCQRLNGKVIAYNPSVTAAVHCCSSELCNGSSRPLVGHVSLLAIGCLLAVFVALKLQTYYNEVVLGSAVPDLAKESSFQQMTTQDQEHDSLDRIFHSEMKQVCPASVKHDGKFSCITTEKLTKMTSNPQTASTTSFKRRIFVQDSGLEMVKHPIL